MIVGVSSLLLAGRNFGSDRRKVNEGIAPTLKVFRGLLFEQTRRGREGDVVCIPLWMQVGPRQQYHPAVDFGDDGDDDQP